MCESEPVISLISSSQALTVGIFNPNLGGVRIFAAAIAATSTSTSTATQPIGIDQSG